MFIILFLNIIYIYIIIFLNIYKKYVKTIKTIIRWK